MPEKVGLVRQVRGPKGDSLPVRSCGPGSLSGLFVRQPEPDLSVTDQTFACPDEQ
jgi:hypothetical protein